MNSTPKDELRRVLVSIELALEREMPEEALALCQLALDMAPGHPDVLFLTADAHRDLRDFENAESYYTRVVLSSPTHSLSWSALATVFFDQLKFERALVAAERALRCQAGNAEALYTRALLRERKGDYNGAIRDYHRAWVLEPIAFPKPIELSNSELENLAIETMSLLDKSLAALMPNISLIIEEVPSFEVLDREQQYQGPGDLLGHFTGSTAMSESVDRPWALLPSTVVLYRRNIARLAHNRELLIQALKNSVFEEMALFFGQQADTDPLLG